VNAYDRLLTWASELGGADWGRWRGVCRYLALEPTTAACALSDLGHVEFDWVDNRFAAAAPAAILLPRSSGSALAPGQSTWSVSWRSERKTFLMTSTSILR
jgi:hypothetical protein